MTTIIRFKNWNSNQKGQHGILVQPAPGYTDAWVIDNTLNAVARTAYTDLPHEDSYTIFWLKERATDEQLETVRRMLRDE